jgi:diadenosine tetraphosphate (Ap4A) HIT family hydrolase
MTEVMCASCDQETRYHTLPPHERIVADQHWRVAHAPHVAQPGWLVLRPRRHVTTIAGLTDAEGASLGTWQLRLSRALRAVVRCRETYVAQDAPTEASAHIHFHLVPRMADRPAAEQVSPARMDAIATGIREYLRRD